MKNLVLCVILNLLYFINAEISLKLTPSEVQLVKLDHTFTIECKVTSTDGSKPTIIWKKNEEEVKSIAGLSNRAKDSWVDKEKTINKLVVEKYEDKDSGNYTCVALQDDKEVARQDESVITNFAVDVPNNINVVEEEKLRIECKLVGNASLHWIFENEIYNTSRGRVILNSNKFNELTYENGIFIIESVTIDDAGDVTCVAVESTFHLETNSTCRVRVKDKYAALWPFLGICAEVIVLCAIIVIYEKKRNKTELEESDTDQSPDQKTNADHGKDTNLRHRQ